MESHDSALGAVAKNNDGNYQCTKEGNWLDKIYRDVFLKRMEEKGALHFEEGEKAKLYYPDWKQEEVCIQETEDFFKESILWKNRINAECNGAAESTVKTGNRRTAANIT